MGVYGGPDINESGLVLCLDAANPKSYVGSGITWRDLSGRGNTGTLVNGVGYSSANKGSLSFDGANDYINMGSSYFISTSIPFTVSCWMSNNPRTQTTSNFHRILTLRSSGTSTLGIAYVNPGNGSEYDGIYLTNATGWVRAKTSYHPTPNVFAMLTVTYNGLGSTNTSNFKIYWSTLELNLTTVSQFPGTSADNNYIGVREDNVQVFKGNISQVSIYNKVLSASEISQNFNAMRGRFGI